MATYKIDADEFQSICEFVVYQNPNSLEGQKFESMSLDNSDSHDRFFRRKTVKTMAAEWLKNVRFNFFYTWNKEQHDTLYLASGFDSIMDLDRFFDLSKNEQLNCLIGSYYKHWLKLPSPVEYEVEFPAFIVRFNNELEFNDYVRNARAWM